MAGRLGGALVDVHAFPAQFIPFLRFQAVNWGWGSNSNLLSPVFLTYPLLHVQVNDPGVFVQSAPSPHGEGREAHSSSSKIDLRIYLARIKILII